MEAYLSNRMQCIYCMLFFSIQVRDQLDTVPYCLGYHPPPEPRAPIADHANEAEQGVLFAH